MKAILSSEQTTWAMDEAKALMKDAVLAAARTWNEVHGEGVTLVIEDGRVVGAEVDPVVLNGSFMQTYIREFMAHVHTYQINAARSRTMPGGDYSVGERRRGGKARDSPPVGESTLDGMRRVVHDDPGERQKEQLPEPKESVSAGGSKVKSF